MFTPSTKFLIKKNNIQKQGVCCTPKNSNCKFSRKNKNKKQKS